MGSFQLKETNNTGKACNECRKYVQTFKLKLEIYLTTTCLFGGAHIRTHTVHIIAFSIT